MTEDDLKQIRNLPRFMLVIQDQSGWSKAGGHGFEPTIHEVIRLSDMVSLVKDAPTT